MSFFLIKDLINLNFIIFFVLFFLLYPFNLGDSLLFEESSILVSPVHIVPEWYFLFAYCILRAIPRKFFGVFFLLLRILIFLIFIMLRNYFISFDIINKFLLF